MFHIIRILEIFEKKFRILTWMFCSDVKVVEVKLGGSGVGYAHAPNLLCGDVSSQIMQAFEVS